jgi:triosephosphate isomerase
MTDRRPIVAGNWKMHKDHLEAVQLVQKLGYLLEQEDHDDQDVVVCPPFVGLRSVQTVIEADELAIQIGAQNCHPAESGAFTGEVSVPMLDRLGVAYVIAGHSERRALFGETDEVVCEKVAAIQRHGLRPILCVGETLDQREAGEAEQVVESQLRGSLDGIAVEDPEALVVAYEPVWAIGTGRTATAEDAQTMCAHVRSVLGAMYDAETAAGIRVQYGGSVKPGNVRELLGQPDIDGALVGGASLAADDFALIVGWRR